MYVLQLLIYCFHVCTKGGHADLGHVSPLEPCRWITEPLECSRLVANQWLHLALGLDCFPDSDISEYLPAVALVEFQRSVAFMDFQWPTIVFLSSIVQIISTHELLN